MRPCSPLAGAAGSTSSRRPECRWRLRGLSLAHLIPLATLLALAVLAPPAFAVTASPELIAPTASSAHSTPLSVEKVPKRLSAVAIAHRMAAQ